MKKCKTQRRQCEMDYTVNDIRPVEYKAVVLPDKVDDSTGGGILIPDSVREKQEYAMDKGIVLAIGEGFFKDLPGPAPKIGDRIMFDKYKGSLVMVDIDGKREKVRIINDKDVCAILGGN